MAFNYGPPGMGGYKEQVEKRQLFLRSYQFSRKQSVGDRIKKSFFRVKKVIWVRLISARKLRKMLCFRIRITGGGGGLFRRKRRSHYCRLELL
ncbi:hypothetical protein ACS0TY_028193 [Phlomoides rotata]